jgi:hypothetical protein
MNEIEIGTKYEDTLGKTKFDKNGDVTKGRAKRIVLITNKTSNSIEYKDEAGFISWVTYDEFIRVENSTNKIRFTKIAEAVSTIR